MDIEELLSIAIETAEKAGKEILEIYRSGDFTIESKEDNSPLTLADKKAHQVIVDMLDRTKIPVISEEETEVVPFSTRRAYEYVWIVDPLDGTREFIKRNDEFTVNIALVLNGSPVLGIIHVPVTGITYWGLKGSGAYKSTPPSESGTPKQIHRLPIVKERAAYTIVASRSHYSPEIEEFIRESKFQYQNVELVSAGSSLKFCLVAEGIADVYPRFGNTMEWDTAAGQAIIEAIGKKVIDYDSGQPIRYNRENMTNDAFLVL